MFLEKLNGTFHKHLTHPIPTPYVVVANFLVKLAIGFVPSGPKFCSRPLCYPRVKVENFVTFTSKCCNFLRKEFKFFFVVLLLDVIYNITAWISNWRLWYFPNFLASLVLSNSTIMTSLSNKNCSSFIPTYLGLRF